MNRCSDHIHQPPGYRQPFTGKMRQTVIRGPAVKGATMSWMFNKPRGPEPAFHDRSWTRAVLADWDRRWDGLSVQARRHFTEHVKAEARTLPPRRRPRRPRGSIPRSSLNWRRPASSRSRRSRTSSRCLHACRGGPLCLASAGTAPLRDTARRWRRPRQLHDPHLRWLPPGTGFLARIVARATGQTTHHWSEDPVEILSRRGRWPDWVADFLDDPLARPILAALRSSSRCDADWRPGRHLPDQSPQAVRATLDKLVNHLALFEDVEQDTYRLLVGFSPPVYQDLQRLRQRTLQCR